MTEPVLKLRTEARLEVRQQVELCTVVATLVHAAKRDDAVRFVAAAERPRHQVGRIDRTLAADEAGLAGDLDALRRRGGTKRLPRQWRRSK